MVRSPEAEAMSKAKVEVAVVEVATKDEAVTRLPNKPDSATASIAPGVVVPMPSLLVEVLAVSRDATPGVCDWISKALPEVVAILKGSEIIREAYCPPIALRVVVPEASVWKAR